MTTEEERAAFKEKLQSLNFGTPRKPRTHEDRSTDTKTTEVIHEDTGRTSGATVTHGDGKVDAKVLHRETTVNPAFAERVREAARG